MANITVPGLPAKTGTILDAAYLHLNESSVDKKVTIAQLLAKIEAQYSADIVTFLGSANKAEGRANLSIDRRVTVDDANYTILATDKVVAQIGTMSAARTFSLPAANTVEAGAEIIVIDESGSVDSTNKIIVQRNGTDTIDGVTQKEIKDSYGVIRLICNGSNSWKSSNEMSASTSLKGISYLNKPVTIANNASDSDHDIDFTAGNFNFDDGTGQAVATALTKQLDGSWTAGDNAGGLDTGTVAADTFYYCFAIYNPTTQTSDFLFSTSTSSPTMPSGYTKKKRIASLVTDGAGNIKNGSYTFFNGGYRFIYSTPVLTGTGLTPAYTTLSVSCPPFSLALIDGDIANNSTASYTKFQVGSKIEGDGIFSGVISSNAASRSSITPSFPIKVDSNSQIDSGFVDGIAAAYALYINGWIEYL
jgi:hypothetical protein